MKVIKRGITAPQGFAANGVSCGIKKAGKLDLALIYSRVSAAAAGVFTTTRFPANHILLDKERLRRGQAQAVLVNSGNANCAVGRAGLTDARNSTYAVARVLGIEPRLVLMASTGIIGKRLPVEKIAKAASSLVKGKARLRGNLAARAIMTTDKKPKEIALELVISGRKVKIGAMAKGAGMISPNMATMLCFITTDADIAITALRKALSLAVGSSFNRISIDGDMSTNDSVLIMANGLANNKKINPANKRDFFIFSEALEYICQYLARQIVLDGEGATKFIQIKVQGAKKETDADKIARRIANSPLFKCAMYGEDPNWGRIAAACGAAGVEIDAQKIEIAFGKTAVFKDGRPLKADGELLKSIFAKRDIEVNVDLHQGKAGGFIWTCDLSEEYVRINARYEWNIVPFR